VAAEAPALHVLVHNAGILRRGRLADTSPEDFTDTLDVNLRAPFFLTQELLPQLRAANGARIVVVSSRAGAMNEGMSGGSMAYRMSKAAVNAFVCNLAAELASDRILVNAMHPGWVRTDMGGRSAAVAPEDGADTVLFLATLPDGGPSGKFWFERRQIDF
jgi:NAD(P)-dependent dehydrogenase (short-subunit alcohol dehydrogenase family)